MRSIEAKLSPTLLNTGINQSAGTRGGIPGSLEYLINGRIRSAGRIEPRCGSSALAPLTKGGGGSRSYADSSAIPRATEHPAFLAYANGEKIVGTTAGDLYAYDGTFLEFRGCFSAAQPVGRIAALASANPEAPISGAIAASAVTSTGYKIVAAGTDALSLMWVVLNPEDVVIYRGEGVTIETGSWPRCVAESTRLILIYQAGTTVTAISHETSTGVVVATSATVMTLAATTAQWDTTGYNSSQWYVAGRTGATTVTVQLVTTLTLGATRTLTTTGEAKVSLWGDATNANVWVGYHDDPGGTRDVGFTVFGAALGTTVFAKTTIVTGLVTAGPALFGPRYSRAGANSDAFYVFYVSAGGVAAARYGYVVSGAVTPSTPHSAFNFFPVSKPDVQQRFWAIEEPVAPNQDLSPGVGQYVLFRHSEAPGSTSPTLTVELATPIDIGHETAYGSSFNYFHAVAVQSESPGDKTYMALPFSLQSVSAGGAVSTFTSAAIFLYEYQRYNQAPTAASSAGDELVIAGQPTSSVGQGGFAGNASYYGGVGACEIGYAQAPRIASAVSWTAGTFVYQAIYKWPDEQGRAHFSAPSPPFELTQAAAGSGAVIVTDTRVGQRHVADSQRVSVLCYRTVDGGIVPQLMAECEVPSATGLVTFTNGDGDATIAQNEFIPTAGGVLPVRLAPSCRYVRGAEERLWCGGLWDRDIIEASRIRVPGEPYQFTGDASHQVVLPDDNTGLAYQDGQLVAFTATGIYLIGGDGPNDQGAGAFLPPRALVRGLGCTEAESASILETELGIVFRSPSSWWLIPRGFGAPVDIGANVQDESPHCLASCVTETTDYRLARFLVTSANSYSADTVLTLDLTNMQWSRDTYSGGTFGTIGAWPEGLVLATYSLERAAAGGVANVLWSESEALDGDAAGTSVYIPLSLRTNWQYPFGPGGWGRINRVQLSAEPLDGGGADVRSDTLTLTIDTDQNTYAPSWGITANSSSGPFYREVVPLKPTCTCYRVTVHAVQTTGAAMPGLRLLSLTAEIGPDGQELGIRPLTNAERS